MSSLGTAVNLRDDILPTKLDIYHHFLHLSKEKVINGDWKKNTPLSEKVKCVQEDVIKLWDKTGIAHCLTGKEGLRKITNIIINAKSTFKVPVARRQRGFADDLKVLFDVALCQHAYDENCTCPPQL